MPAGSPPICLAQAEHDVNAQSILITTDAGLAAEVECAVESQLATLPRADIARASWNDFGAIITGEKTRRCDYAGECDRRRASGDHDLGSGSFGAENPQCRRDLPRPPHPRSDRRLCRRFQSCAADRALGAVLLGPRRARLHEADLDPEMRSRNNCARWGSAAMILGKAEGLDAHARSVGLRLNLP